ncbi:MAG: flagellin [Eubacteriaceae bacterium]
MRINHNISAMNTYSRMSSASSAQAKSLEKLSSGLRINKAGDDAAGLAISEKMRGQIGGLDQAVRNAQDGISMIQTAEGALSESHSILNRMRELAVQASNDTNTDDDRAEIQKEMNQLTSEISRIGNNTEFNTKKLINGQMSGAGSGATHEANTIAFDAGFTANTAHADVTLSLGGTTYTIAFAEGTDSGTGNVSIDASTNTITVGIQDAVNVIGTDVANGLNQLIGAESGETLNEFTVTSGGADEITITAKATGIYAGAAGAESIKLTSGLDAGKITQDTNGTNGTDGNASLQVGANQDQQFTVNIGDMRALANLKISGTTAGAAHSVTTDAYFTTGADNQLTDISASGTPEYALDITSADKATNAITVLDAAIQTVSAERSKLGAYQNRLDHTINNLTTTSENLTAAESRIRDVDMAKEMMDFTKNNILSQAATSMLAQANQMPQAVLQLLR